MLHLLEQLDLHELRGVSRRIAFQPGVPWRFAIPCKHLITPHPERITIGEGIVVGLSVHDKRNELMLPIEI